jgi:pyruvate dehydrogenase E2 component (dihydrolipoamide acetyltransferase)
MAEAAGLEIDAIEGTGTGGRVTTEDVQRALAHMEDGGPAASSLPAPADAPGTRLRPSSIKASPRAREMAAQAGLDLSKVEGTGPQGRIMVRDVERALAAAPAELVDVLPSPPAPPAGLPVAGQIIPLSGVRGVIARRMSESTRTAAAVTTTAQADATTLVGLRAALRQEWHALSGPAPSYNDLFVVILGKALAEFAYMNAHILDEQIHLMAEINIGLAVDTDRGLVVPVLRSVQGMSLAEVTRASADLVKRARGGKLLPDDLNGGTFTLSNLGAFDVDASTPIINLPECAVLGVGRIAPRPAVVDGALGVRQTVTLSLTYDHRAIDGAPAARFLQRVKQLVEQPGLAFVTRQGPAGGSPSSAGHVAG